MLGLKQRSTITACLVLSTLTLPVGTLSYIAAAPIRLAAVAAHSAGLDHAAYTLANAAISIGGAPSRAHQGTLGTAQAETMSSTNYRVQTDILSQGGGGATSASYAGDDTIGDLATGEDLASASYRACAGYECFSGEKFITFEVTAGLTSPGVTGDSVDFGTLNSSTVHTSNHTTVNSAFLFVDSNAIGGVVITVVDEFNGLKHVATADLVASQTETLTPGDAGYGVCVFSSSEDAESPSTLNPASPYDGTCDTTTGHDVGAVSTSPATILSASSYIAEGEAEVLVKAAISGTSAAGQYSDTITFVATGTY